MSYYDVPTFSSPMTVDDAKQAYQAAIDAINTDLKTRSQAAIDAGNPADAKKFALDAQKAQSDLSLAFNTYMVTITPAEEAVPSHPSATGPVPESAPAPSP